MVFTGNGRVYARPACPASSGIDKALFLWDANQIPYPERGYDNQLKELGYCVIQGDSKYLERETLKRHDILFVYDENGCCYGSGVPLGFEGQQQHLMLMQQHQLMMMQQKQQEDNNTTIYNYSDTMFVVFCATLVFLMQGGFAMLVAGVIRKKNVGNTMIKNLMTLLI